MKYKTENRVKNSVFLKTQNLQLYKQIESAEERKKKQEYTHTNAHNSHTHTHGHNIITADSCYYMVEKQTINIKSNDLQLKINFKKKKKNTSYQKCRRKVVDTNN